MDGVVGVDVDDPDPDPDVDDEDELPFVLPFVDDDPVDDAPDDEPDDDDDSELFDGEDEYRSAYQPPPFRMKFPPLICRFAVLFEHLGQTSRGASEIF